MSFLFCVCPLFSGRSLPGMSGCGHNSHAGASEALGSLCGISWAYTGASGESRFHWHLYPGTVPEDYE